MKKEWSRLKLYSMKSLIEGLENLRMDDEEDVPLIGKIKQELIERLNNDD